MRSEEDAMTKKLNRLNLASRRQIQTGRCHMKEWTWVD